MMIYTIALSALLGFCLAAIIFYFWNERSFYRSRIKSLQRQFDKQEADSKIQLTQINKIMADVQKTLADGYALITRGATNVAALLAAIQELKKVQIPAAGPVTQTQWNQFLTDLEDQVIGPSEDMLTTEFPKAS